MTAPVQLNLQPPTEPICTVKLPQIGPFGGRCTREAVFSIQLEFAVPGISTDSGTVVNICEFHLRLLQLVYETYMHKKQASQAKPGKDKKKP